MPGPHKGVSTQHTTQQTFAKPRHQPLERDQQARDRLKQAKIKSCAYIQLAEKALQTVHQTFELDIPLILHLLALTNTTTHTDTVPMLFVIQEGINCMPTTDYFFTSIKPEPIIVSRHRENHSKQTVQQATTQDQISQQTHPLWTGETRVYPSMLADKQVSVFNLTESSITSQADLQAAFQSIRLCSHGGVESKEDENSDYLSDSDSSEDEVSQHLRTSQEERLYSTVKGSAQATQAALAHTTVQCNPTVERGLPKQPKIKKLSKGQALEKATQTKEKDKPL